MVLMSRPRDLLGGRRAATVATGTRTACDATRRIIAARSRRWRWIDSATGDRRLWTGRRRARTRCTPTDALSNTVISCASNGPRGWGCAGDDGTVRGSRYRAGVSVRGRARDNGLTTSTGTLTDA